MRPTRFEKKGIIAHKNQVHDDHIVAHYRPEVSAVNEPLCLGHVSFDENACMQDLEKSPYGFDTDRDLLEWLCALAGESPTARLLMRGAQEQGWTLGLADLSGNAYSLDGETLQITLDHCGLAPSALGRSAHFRHLVFMNFIRALREIWHDNQDYAFDEGRSPESIVMLERARRADIETMAILTGWEIRAAGYTDIWRYILGADEGDMAMIFTRAMEKDPAGFYDGSILTRTFCQWYGDGERVARHDADTLQWMDDDLKDGHRFGAAMADAADVEMISSLPMGGAYLSGMGANIMVDPYFTAMHDPINESHLEHISYDCRITMVEGVPFRDAKLAGLIFPVRKLVSQD